MRSRFHILCLCFLCALPLVVGQCVASESAVVVCRKLVEESREVGRVLRTVSDRESGAAAAAELRARMEYMRKATEQLGHLPVASAEEARVLEQMMRDLTHITQGYMPVVQRLAEVNAYGADELIALFQYYKMSSEVPASFERLVETPLVQAYSEWCDSIEDMLFSLRRAQNAESAAASAPELTAALRKAEQRAAQVESLQNGLSPQQVESERVPVERIQRLRRELRTEQQRIRSADCFQSDELRQLVDASSRAARA